MADFALDGSFTAPLPPEFREVEPFCLRARSRLFPGPLDPAQDWEQFGCHRIAGFPPEPEFLAEARPAAVLVPVVRREHGLSIVLTERAAHLSTHAGQVAFPGGRVEPGESAAQAALREAQEEIGLSPSHVEPLGYLPPYFSGTGYRVQPLVAVLGPGTELLADANEVARLFEVPLAHALDTRRYRRGEIFWRGRERSFFILDYPDAYIWGVTAGIMRSFADRF
ncbi:MAG: CoA pyrophosphatase [Methylobacterium sp.]|nr:CoA pyrophosphatase [Methylobacterium sp.]MCA3604172.1 CoA pyrophosphatase [Methylobacterium sp.]MCA3615497.1 CoA pyrophosphatase [Methylobacterium sp.]MCA4910638.1 CoA pyrophosphatase [Methylobacterium sp.]